MIAPDNVAFKHLLFMRASWRTIQPTAKKATKRPIMAPRYTKLMKRVNTSQPATRPASRLIFLARNILEEITVQLQIPRRQNAEKSIRKWKIPPATRNGVVTSKNRVTAHEASASLNARRAAKNRENCVTTSRIMFTDNAAVRWAPVRAVA